jgi:hypothetical protein
MAKGVPFCGSESDTNLAYEFGITHRDDLLLMTLIQCFRSTCAPSSTMDRLSQPIHLKLVKHVHREPAWEHPSHPRTNAKHTFPVPDTAPKHKLSGALRLGITVELGEGRGEVRRTAKLF